MHCQNYANNDYFSMEESYHIYLPCFKACLRLKKKKKVIMPFSLVKIWGTTLWNLACMVFLDRSKSSAIPDVCLISMPWTNRPRLLQMCWRCYETGPNICMHIISNEPPTHTLSAQCEILRISFQKSRFNCRSSHNLPVSLSGFGINFQAARFNSRKKSNKS